MKIVSLGETVKDIVTGYEGVVTSVHEYLHGCRRIEVSSREMRDGKPVDSFVFDEQRLEVLDVPNILDVAPMTNRPGGDRPVPQRTTPPRY